MQLSLFKNYLQWKCLHFWYKHISRNKYHWARDEIQAPLAFFFLSDPLQNASLIISNLIFQTIEMSIYNGSITEENTLQEFIEQQVCYNKAIINSSLVFKCSSYF